MSHLFLSAQEDSFHLVDNRPAKATKFGQRRFQQNRYHQQRRYDQLPYNWTSSQAKEQLSRLIFV